MKFVVQVRLRWATDVDSIFGFVAEQWSEGRPLLDRERLTCV